MFVSCGLLPAQLPRHRITKSSACELVQQALLALGENKDSVQTGPWPYPLAPEFHTLSAWRGANYVGPDGVGILPNLLFRGESMDR